MARVGTNESQIQKIESGAIDTRRSMMFALIATLEASADDLLRVYHDLDLSVDAAAERATAWLRLCADEYPTPPVLASLFRAPQPHDALVVPVEIPLWLAERVGEYAALQGRTVPVAVARRLSEEVRADPGVLLFGGYLQGTYWMLCELARRRDALPVVNHRYRGQRSHAPERTAVLVDDQPSDPPAGRWFTAFEWGKQRTG